MHLQPIIGIEIHIELKTQTKMFSAAPVTFAKEPNTQVNEMDLGYPGSLPTVNKQAVILGIWACKALNMQINSLLAFDRKHYFYPDLPKGYQLTQQKHPLGRNGYLLIDVNGKETKITINRLHLEEDTAKQIHTEQQTLLDYNRAGIPLIEVVTDPVIYDADTAVNYIETLRQTLLHLQVSDAKMNEGSMRCDINISLSTNKQDLNSARVEIKNLNSLFNVRKAIEFEIDRQSKLIKANKPLKHDETRRFDEKTKTTILMRVKDQAVDYKFLEEPNIVPISLDNEWINEVINDMALTYQQKLDKYVKVYKLNFNEVKLLLQNYELSQFFSDTIKYTKQYRLVLNVLIGGVSNYLKEKNITIKETKLTSFKLAKIIEILHSQFITQPQSKILLIYLLENDIGVESAIKTLKLEQINDEQTLENLMQPFIKENFDKLQKQDTTKNIRICMGYIMKVTKGQANPLIAQKVIQKLIDKFT